MAEGHIIAEGLALVCDDDLRLAPATAEEWKRLQLHQMHQRQEEGDAVHTTEDESGQTEEGREAPE